MTWWNQNHSQIFYKHLYKEYSESVQYLRLWFSECISWGIIFSSNNTHAMILTDDALKLFSSWIHYKEQYNFFVSIKSFTWNFQLVIFLDHQIEPFSALLVICAGNSPVPGEFPSQRPVKQSIDIFFDMCLNKGLRKQSWLQWWFATPSCSLPCKLNLLSDEIRIFRAI